MFTQGKLAMAASLMLSLSLTACGGGGGSSGSSGSSSTTYTIGGTVSGLDGAGLVLQNNGSDDLAINSNGSFSFDTELVNGESYYVSVATNPTSPAQVCSVSNGSGYVSSDVRNVTISCASNSYSVGGSVSGLSGSGLVLQNNSGDDMSVSASGSFTFGAGVPDGDDYAVSVKSNPTSPSQSCSVSNASGTIASADVANVSVSCLTNSFAVNASVSGLSGNGLTLNDGETDISIGANGTTTLGNYLDGSSYSFSVSAQPASPDQYCSVTSGTGAVSGSDVEITLSCADVYAIGGTVTGLTGTGLTLQNNAGDDLNISANGSFIFTTGIADGNDYAVTVSTQPGSPTQTCSVSNGSGTVSGSDVTNVSISCLSSYTIGGTVSGLNGSGLVLQNNDGDDLSISANGSFTFSTGVVAGNGYSVSVKSEPTSLSQTCTVSNASGTIAASNVTDVAVSCRTDVFDVTATVSGLSGSGLQLNDGESNTSISADGTYVMGNYNDGSSYAVSVASQPTSPNQYCSVTGGSGTVSGSAVDITVSCVNSYTIGGTISGLNGRSTVVLQNNSGDDLSLNSDGRFTFDTAVVDTSSYSVVVSSQPTSTDQYCNVIYGSGTVSSADVSNIEVVCVDGLYNVVDTNQTECYNSLTGATKDCSGTGQDGEYSGNQPSYTSYTVVSSESVVLDNNTGLMWQANSDTDGVSGLNSNDKMTWSEGVSYCADLDYGSYSDWRVPSIKELYSIYLMSGYDLSGVPGATSNGTTVDHSGIPPFIDTGYFDLGYGDTANGERAIDGQYLSSTLNLSPDMSGITYEWMDTFFGVNFVDGHLKSYEKEPDASGIIDATYYLRCVRGNPDYGSNNLYSSDSWATVTDSDTKLMWEQSDHHADDYEGALSICNSATTGGHSDWRLPNAKELQSLVDYDNSPDATGNPAIDTSLFSSTSFTNEAGNTDYGYYWSGTALLNSSGSGNKGAYITFGRGLGYFSDYGIGVVDVHGAGAQRGDNKSAVSLSHMTAIDVSGVGCTFGDTAYSSGPQGDIVRVVNNYVRCVRDLPDASLY